MPTIVKAAWHGFLRFLKRRRHRAQLLRLADLGQDALRDIGLTSSDFRSAFRTPFYRDPSAAQKQKCCGWKPKHNPSIHLCC